MRIKFKQWTPLAKGELAAVVAVGLLAVVMCVSAVSKVRFKWAVSKAWSGLSSGNADEAIPLFDAVIAERPNLPGALDVRAGLLMGEKKFAEAKSDYERLASSDDPVTAARGHLGLGILKLEQAKAKKSDAYRPDAARSALADFKSAVEKDPALGDAYLARATAHLWLGEVQAAAKSIGKTFEVRGISTAALPHLYYCRGVVLAQAATAGPETIEKIVSSLGMKLSTKPDEVLNRARLDFEQVRKLDAGWDDPEMNLAVCMLLEAQTRAEKLTEQDLSKIRHMLSGRISKMPGPERAKFQAIMGDLYLRAGKADQALREFSRAVTSDNTVPMYSLYRASCSLAGISEEKSSSTRSRMKAKAREALRPALKLKGLSARQRYDGWIRVIALTLDPDSRRTPALSNVETALKGAQDALAELKDHKPTEIEQAILNVAEGTVWLAKGDAAKALPLFTQAGETMKDDLNLTKLVRTLNARPAIGAFAAIDPSDVANMQPIVQASDVYIRSCAKTLARDQITVTFNDEPGFWEISGGSTVLAIPKKPLADGKVTCVITVTDTLGNSTPRTVEIFVDGQPPELDSVEPVDGAKVPPTGTVFGINLKDASSGVDLDSVMLTAYLSVRAGGLGSRQYKIIMNGVRQYSMKELNTLKGDHLMLSNFKITFTRPMAEGTLKFMLVCKDKAGHPMRANWKYNVKPK